MVSRIINCKFVFYLGIFTCHLFAATKMPMPIITPSDTVFVGDLGASIAVPESAMVIYTQDGTDPSEKNGELRPPAESGPSPRACIRGTSRVETSRQ